MEFASGDSGGIFHQLISLSIMKARANLNYVLRIIIPHKAIPFRIDIFQGLNSKVFSPEFQNNNDAFIIPLKTQIPVFSLMLIPAQTCTFTGCLAPYIEGNQLHILIIIIFFF